MRDSRRKGSERGDEVDFWSDILPFKKCCLLMFIPSGDFSIYGLYGCGKDAETLVLRKVRWPGVRMPNHMISL